VRVATWNVNGLKARFDFLCHWLRERRPDLVALQELKLVDEQFPKDELEALGYRALCHGQKSWNGVAILSRQPAEATQRGLPGQEELGARLLTARVDGVLFTSVYVPNGKHVGHEDFARKLAWLDALADHLAAQRDAGPAHVVGGDFNVCPAPLDSWNEAALHGQIFHTDAERARFRRLAEVGLVDVFRASHPELRAFSWWDYRGGAFHRGQGLRIDCLLASGPLASRVREAQIDRDWRKKQQGLTPSDHAPVWADLEAAQPA
jgi:exodeoxyribonuclease-3